MKDNDIIKNSSEDWVSLNPILENGAIGMETDTGRYKIGDGIASWGELLYAESSITDELGDSHTLAMSQFGMTGNLSVINIPRLTQNNNTTLIQAINLIPDSYFGYGYILLHRYDNDNYLYFYTGDANGRKDKTKYILMSTTFSFNNVWSLKSFSDLIDNGIVYVPENWAVTPTSVSKNSDLWLYNSVNLVIGHIGRFRPFIKSSNIKLSPLFLETEIIELDKIIKCKWVENKIVSDNTDYFMVPLRLKNNAVYSTNIVLSTYSKVCAFTPGGEYLEWTSGNSLQTNEPYGTEYYYAGKEIDFNIIEGLHDKVHVLQIPEERVNIDWQTKLDPFEKISSIVNEEFTKRVEEFLNGSAFIKGEGINTGGNVMYDESYGRTDYVELLTGYEYCYFGYTGGSMQAVSLYDKDKNLVRQINGPNETTEPYHLKLSFRATGNEVFARFSYMGEWVNNIISVGKYIYGNTVSELQTNKNAINIIDDHRGDSCRMQSDKGRFIDSFTVISNDAEVSLDQDNTRWNEFSYRLKWKDSASCTVNLNEDLYGNQSVGFWINVDYEVFDKSPGLYSIVISLAKDNIIVKQDVEVIWTEWFLWPGWNFIRIDPDQIGCTCYNQLILKFNKCDGSGSRFYCVNIDSVVIGQKSKPVITLSYDDLWPDTFNTGVYDLHKELNLPVTISSTDFYKNTDEPYYNILKELIDSGIMEIGIYSGELINEAPGAGFKEKYDYFFDLFTRPQLKYPGKIITCNCSRNEITPAMKAVADMCGAKMYRATGLVKNCYVDRINNMITTNAFNLKEGESRWTSEAIKRAVSEGEAYIDDIICKGYFGGYMAHAIQNAENITDLVLQTPLEVWKQFLYYIAKKRNAGEIEVLTIGGLYRKCVN